MEYRNLVFGIRFVTMEIIVNLAFGIAFGIPNLVFGIWSDGFIGHLDLEVARAWTVVKISIGTMEFCWFGLHCKCN